MNTYYRLIFFLLCMFSSTASSAQVEELSLGANNHSIVRSYQLPTGMLHSLDLDRTQLFPRLSGMANNLIAYQPIWQTVSTNCQSFEPITTKYDKAKVREVASRENASFFHQLFTTPPTVFTINANTICE